MSKVATALDVYRKDGVGRLWEAIRNWLLLGQWAPTVRSVVGKRLHQKILACPRVGYWPRIREPRTFNEKIMHRKLYTDEDRFAIVEDKWAVREYVAERVGEDVLSEVYHVTDDPETIPFDSLPDEYVLKPTHLSGSVTIIDEHQVPDREALRQDCRDWLNRTHGVMKGEYWYSEIEPRILVEERLRGVKQDIPRDFKFHVFHGRVEFVHVIFDRYTDPKKRFYDRAWNPRNFGRGKQLGPEIAKPRGLEQMINIAEVLGSQFDYIRVDLYQTRDDGIVFGELTLSPDSGFAPFEPREWDFRFGSLW